MLPKIHEPSSFSWVRWRAYWSSALKRKPLGAYFFFFFLLLSVFPLAPECPGGHIWGKSLPWLTQSIINLLERTITLLSTDQLHNLPATGYRGLYLAFPLRSSPRKTACNPLLIQPYSQTFWRHTNFLVSEIKKERKFGFLIDPWWLFFKLRFWQQGLKGGPRFLRGQ